MNRLVVTLSDGRQLSCSSIEPIEAGGFLYGMGAGVTGTLAEGDPLALDPNLTIQHRTPGDDGWWDTYGADANPRWTGRPIEYHTE